jgi:3-keto-5-aminohexanoate cleavage enzyme
MLPKKMRLPWKLEPKYMGDLGKPLIINVAPGQAMTYRDQNPNLAYSPKELSQQVIGAYNAGASMVHVHLRDPQEGHMMFGDDVRVKLHLEYCDLIFEECPDIITNPGEGATPPTEWEAVLVKEESIGPKVRLAEYVEPLLKAGNGTARYIETHLINCHTLVTPVLAVSPEATWEALAEKFAIIVDTPSNWVHQVRYMQERGIKPELVIYNDVGLHEVKEWLIEEGVVQKPYFFDLCLGVHNSFHNIPSSVGIEHMLRMMRSFPDGSVIQAICGGRNQMAMTAVCIAAGVDIVRTGMEEGIYKYPHKDDLISSCAEQVDRVVQIARALGRQIATPAQARRILGLKPLQKSLKRAR